MSLSDHLPFAATKAALKRARARFGREQMDFGYQV